MADDRILIEIDANDQASEKIRAVSRALNDLDRNTSGISRNNGAQDFFRNTYNSAYRVNSAMRNFQTAISGVTRTTQRLLREAGAAIWDFTSDSIRAFDEFSEAHAKMLGVIGANKDYYDSNGNFLQQKYQDDAQALKQQAIQIGSYGTDGRGSLETPTDVAELQLTLSRAGISAETMLDPNSNIMDSLIKFAKGNDVEMESAVQFAVSLGNQFGYKPEQWGEMLDKVAHTADLAPIDVKDIVESMKYAGGITSGLGRDMEETLAMVATLGNFGLRGSQAGSGIQALMTRLLTQDTTVITDAQAEVAPPKALQAFYDFSKYAKSDGLAGVTYDDFKNIVANGGTYEDLGELSGNLRPMDEVIDQLDEAMSDLNDEEQAWFAKKFFGLYQMKAAYGLMSGEEQDLNEIITDIKEQSAGSNERKYSEIIESGYGKSEALKSAIEGTKIDLGDRLSPFTNKIRDELIAFLNDPAHYEIDFNGLHDALDEACDLIEEKYGTAIADAVRNLGDFAIDFTQVAKDLAPEFGEGIGQVFSSLLDGDVFGAMGDWNEMITNMHESADALPEDLQDLGNAVVGVIDWMGKLIALDIASEVVELISSLVMTFSVLGGAIVNAGSVIVNGTGVGGTGAGGAGTGGAAAGGAGRAAGAGSRALLSGESVVGSADDVARALGTSADDVIATFGEQASYTIDDIARGLGSSTDDVINAYASSIDDVIAAGAGSLDDVVTGSSKLWGSLSGVGKTLGVLGTGLQIGIGGYQVYKDIEAGDYEGAAGTAGNTAGAVGGGIVGAEIGTAIFPGVGTIAGAVIGSVGGGFTGEELGKSAYNDFTYGTTGIGVYDEWKRQKNKDDLTLQHIKDDQNTQDLQSLAKALDEKNLGSGWFGMNTDEWIMALANPMGDKGAYAEYDKMSGNDKITFQGLLNQYSTTPLGNSDKFEEYWLTGDWKLTTEERNAKANKNLEETTNALREVGAQMITVTKNNKYSEYYDKSLDKTGYGYSVWTGTQEELERYKKAQEGTARIVSSDYDPTVKGTVDTPYMFDELDTKIATGIANGIAQAEANKNDGQQLTGLGQEIANMINEGLASGSFTIEKADVVGELNIPNIAQEIASNYPGWNALSDKGKEQVIENAIDNNITIDDSVTMTPSFNVSAPNVNVDVKVDQSGNVTKNIITTPGTGSLLDSFISKTSSQYGQSNNASNRVNRGQR